MFPRALALVALALACLGLATAATAAANQRHVPGFDLLSRQVAVSKLPWGLRIGFEFAAKHGRKARFGSVRLDEGILSGAGNYRWVCSSYRAQGEPKFGGDGGCAPRAQVVREGLISICGSGGGRLTVHGLVPNGTATVELDRDRPGLTIAVPVVRNAFALRAPPANFTFRALDAAGEPQIEHRYPLAGAHGGGCYSFFEASADPPGAES